MKQVLLGTTALLAAGLLSGQAMAQASKADPVKLQFFGTLNFVGGDIVRQNDGPNSLGQNKTNFQFKEANYIGGMGETKLDNGLVPGVSILLRGNSAGASVKSQFDGNTGAARTPVSANDAAFQYYGYFKGDFGELRFGDYRDAIALKTYQAPLASAILGQNTPLFAYTNNPIGTNSTYNDLGGNRDTKIGYFSPSLAGFSFATTFVPVSSKSVTSGSGCAGYSNNGGGTEVYLGANVGCTAYNNTFGALDNIAAIHLNYDAKFGDFTLGVGGGASHATKEKGFRTNAFAPGASATGAYGLVNSDGDRNDYTASFNLIYGPFAVGAAWERQQNLFFNGANSNVFDVGGRYTIGPAAFSLGATRGAYKGFLANAAGLGSGTIVNGVAVRPANFNPTATPSLTDISFTTNYQLGPGIFLTGAIDYNIYHAHSPDYAGQPAYTKNYESIALITGTRIIF